MTHQNLRIPFNNLVQLLILNITIHPYRVKGAIGGGNEATNNAVRGEVERLKS